jgi:hypothetical protein
MIDVYGWAGMGHDLDGKYLLPFACTEQTLAWLVRFPWWTVDGIEIRSAFCSGTLIIMLVLAMLLNARAFAVCDIAFAAVDVEHASMSIGIYGNAGDGRTTRIGILNLVGRLCDMGQTLNKRYDVDSLPNSSALVFLLQMALNMGRANGILTLLTDYDLASLVM